MVSYKLIADLEVAASADDVWGIIGSKDAPKFFMDALPGVFEKIEVLEGDGGVGTVLLIVYPEGSEPLSNEEKFVTMDDHRLLKEILQTKGGYLDMGVTYYMETLKVIKCGNSCIIQSIVEYKAPEEVAAKVSSLISVEGLLNMAKIVARHVLEAKASSIAAV
ncbi:hypothetical protein MKW94_004408 [Papaver nudicaule]|uniref:Bet v I/Major latex protein domain-containing protein n=1 Tax=Papaver nudicaule TaxID=74823 RepID=A0AA41VW72_PAPNU|nr:hypothetical protein [Papaver nudicaule]